MQNAVPPFYLTTAVKALTWSADKLVCLILCVLPIDASYQEPAKWLRL